jgi:signal transduction histidine kinase
MRRAGLSVGCRTTGSPHPLPQLADLAAYRVVQESLTNALKHAGPGRAEVRVGGRVVVEVLSPLGDGAGLPGSGAGLIGMRERAVLLGGEFSAGPRDGCWRVRAELPLDGAAR